MLKRSKLKFVKIRQNLLKDIDYWFPIIDIIYALYGGNDNENNKIRKTFEFNKKTITLKIHFPRQYI